MHHVIKQLLPSRFDNWYLDFWVLPPIIKIYVLGLSKKMVCKETPPPQKKNYILQKTLKRKYLSQLPCWSSFMASYIQLFHQRKCNEICRVQTFLNFDFDNLACWITGCYDFRIYSEHPWDLASLNIFLSCTNRDELSSRKIFGINNLGCWITGCYDKVLYSKHPRDPAILVIFL